MNLTNSWIVYREQFVEIRNSEFICASGARISDSCESRTVYSLHFSVTRSCALCFSLIFSVIGYTHCILQRMDFYFWNDFHTLRLFSYYYSKILQKIILESFQNLSKYYQISRKFFETFSDHNLKFLYYLSKINLLFPHKFVKISWKIGAKSSSRVQILRRKIGVKNFSSIFQLEDRF